MKTKKSIGIFVSLALLACFALFIGIRELNTKHNIKLIVDGQVYATIETKGNEYITLPNNPLKEEFLFDGWYFDKPAWQNELTSNTFKNKKLNEDVKAYAKFSLASNNENDVNEENENENETGKTEESDIQSDYLVIKDGTITGVTKLFTEEQPTTFTIPDGVKTIGSDAFRACTSLTSIVIPSSVESIKMSAFHNCYNLTEVIFEEGLKSIDKFAFYDCISLTNLKFPNSLETIGKSAFTNCGCLTSVTLGSGLNTIDESAFKNCPALAEIYNLSELFVKCGTTRDGEIALNAKVVHHSADEQSRIMNDTENKLCYYVYDKEYTLLCCYNKDVVAVELNENTTEILSSVFNKCIYLENVTIPDSVNSVGSYAFSGCSSLENVTIGNGVTNIGDSVFAGCKNLSNLTIGSSLTELGTKPFSGCEKLGKINFLGDIESWLKLNISFADFSPRSFSHQLYLNNELATDIVIPQTINCIDSKMFYGLGCLKNIVIGDNVTEIKNDAFFGCINLTSITLSKSVNYIGNFAFFNCFSLEKVNYTGSIEDWCNIEFSNCEANPLAFANNLYMNNELVTDLVIPNTITNIKNLSFYGCKSIETVTLPQSIKSIGNSAFSFCTNLTKVNYCGNINTWCNIDFSDCDSNPLTYAHNLYINNNLVTKLDMPNGIKSINKFTFFGCTSITTVNTNKVEYIAEFAFYNCTGIESINFSSSLKNIGDNAFANCRSLKNVKIPDSVVSIGSSAFSQCKKLESIEIGKKVSYIGKDVLKGCDSLCYVVFADAQGWWCSKYSVTTEGTNINKENLSDKYIATLYITDIFSDCFWNKSK